MEAENHVLCLTRFHPVSLTHTYPSSEEDHFEWCVSADITYCFTVCGPIFHLLARTSAFRKCMLHSIRISSPHWSYFIATFFKVKTMRVDFFPRQAGFRFYPPGTAHFAAKPEPMRETRFLCLVPLQLTISIIILYAYTFAICTLRAGIDFKYYCTYIERYWEGNYCYIPFYLTAE